MAASARIALSFLSIYVLQYVWFASKTTQDHSLNDVLSPVVLRIRVPDRDVNFLAVVRFQRGLSRLLLTLNGHHKLQVAAINWGKRGNTTLAVPCHDPPVEITIFIDVEINPGPDSSQYDYGERSNVEYHLMADLPRSTLTLQYSHRQHYCFPTFKTLFILKHCGIFKFRGRRVGRNRRIQLYANLSFPFRSRSLSCRGVSLHNLTYVERRKDSAVVQESSFSSLVLYSVNVRSVKSKSADLLDYTYTLGADLFAFTETWLTANDTAAKLEFIPPQTHKFLHHNRSGRKGGGTGLLFRENIDVSKIDEGERTSFEFLEWSLNTNSFRARLSIIYRPPYSNLHPVSLKTFFDDFASYMESIILTPEPLIISDFNIHVNNTNDSDACEFLDLLAGKSCRLDLIPPTIVLKLLDVLLPVITELINLSFDTGRFAEAWREALVLPSLKKPGLDFGFKNFRPVSNLSYISNLSERAGAEQFMEHLTANNLHSQLQSAYKQQHSTETALLKVKNDILMSMDEQHVTLLVLLDLSAAFDTIHHDKLIGRLESDLGITDNALAWFKLYLPDRF